MNEAVPEDIKHRTGRTAERRNDTTFATTVVATESKIETETGPESVAEVNHEVARRHPTAQTLDEREDGCPAKRSTLGATREFGVAPHPRVKW